jgi:hypothetical protein
MTDTTTLLQTGRVDVRENLSTEEFYREYVGKKPVVIKGALADLPAVSKWSIPYLASLAPDLKVRLKTGDLANVVTVNQTLSEYSAFVDDLEAGRASVDGPPPYLHDLPLLQMIDGLQPDLEPFPVQRLTPFFRRQWWTFPQFFVGPRDSVTPLHFDTLQTHNLFYQLHGSKRFLTVNAEDRKYCYTFNWRWSHVDAENPDFEAHPLYRNARVAEAVVEAGDQFYMPPGTLHHVRSLSPSISFNIDWHDRRSALRGLTAVRDGMPRQNLRYNALFALGVWAGLPLKAMMPMLKSFFYYLS